MYERSEIIAWIRGELVGPTRLLSAPATITFQGRDFADPEPQRRGPLVWERGDGTDPEEVLYFDRESPHRKYGAGQLHPVTDSPVAPEQAALMEKDTLGTEPSDDEVFVTDESGDQGDTDAADEGGAISDDFEVSSPDIRHPSTLGLSFCVEIQPGSQIILRLPERRRFFWQKEDAKPFPLNGRYELCDRKWSRDGKEGSSPTWRRVSAVPPDCQVVINQAELVPGQVVRRDVAMQAGSPISLRFEVFPRTTPEGNWLLTAVLRNTSTPSAATLREAVLYQTLFEVEIANGRFAKYPESERPFDQLDRDEQSLALLYREAATWAIGHGCAAGWDSEPDRRPDRLYADVMPAVELPSMTPDIVIDDAPLQISMRSLAELSDSRSGPGWEALERLGSSAARLSLFPPPSQQSQGATLLRARNA
jgi:hypothetical protein